MNVEELFKNMSYGTSLETSTKAKDWIEAHHSEFGPFVAGLWQKSGNEVVIENASTSEKLATIRANPKEDLKLAVQSAGDAKDLGPISSRSEILHSLSVSFQGASRLLAELECISTGRPFHHIQNCLIPRSVNQLAYYARCCLGLKKDEPNWQCVGLVVVNIPASSSVSFAVEKMVPALAAGNRVVLCLEDLKDKKCANLALFLIAELAINSGLQAGLLNLVYMTEPLSSLIGHCGPIGSLAYCGTLKEGREVRKVTSGSGTKLSLFLEHRNVLVIFESADIESAVEALLHSLRESCEEEVVTRLLVQESVTKKVGNLLKARLANLRVRDGFDANADFGPLAKKQITELATYFLSLGDDCEVTQVMLPKLHFLTFRTAKEACDLANDCLIDLRVSLWTENMTLALEMTKNVKAGTVWVNSFNEHEPFVEIFSRRLGGNGIRGGEQSLYQYMRPSTCHFRHLGWNRDCGDADRNAPKLDSFKKIVDSALKSQAGWKSSFAERSRILFTAYNAVFKDQKNLSKMVRGNEAELEVAKITDHLAYLASGGGDCGTRVQVSPGFKGEILQMVESLGVIGVFVSNEFKAADSHQLINLILSAVWLGNAVVLCVGTYHQFLTSLAKSLNSSGLPPGILSVLEVDGPLKADSIIPTLARLDVQGLWHFCPNSDSIITEYSASENQLQRTWSSFEQQTAFDQAIMDDVLRGAKQTKTVWLPSGVTFAN